MALSQQLLGVHRSVPEACAFVREEILYLHVFCPQAPLRHVRLEPNVDGHLVQDISGTRG